MSLRDRQESQQLEKQGGMTQPHGATATWAPPYTIPIHGTVDGEPVRILQIGDLHGFSPVYLCVDEDGFSAPVRVSDVVINDGAFLPLKHTNLRSRVTASSR